MAYENRKIGFTGKWPGLLLSMFRSCDLIWQRDKQLVCQTRQHCQISAQVSPACRTFCTPRFTSSPTRWSPATTYNVMHETPRFDCAISNNINASFKKDRALQPVAYASFQ
eukprot:scaffold209891_cov15-Tisochrysis_lutea.AAC.1